MALSMHWTTDGASMTWEEIHIAVMQMRLDFAPPSFLNLVKPDILRKHKGLWVCVSEYGIILNCAKTKEDLEHQIIPHNGCANLLIRVP